MAIGSPRLNNQGFFEVPVVRTVELDGMMDELRNGCASFSNDQPVLADCVPVVAVIPPRKPAVQYCKCGAPTSSSESPGQVAPRDLMGTQCEGIEPSEPPISSLPAIR